VLELVVAVGRAEPEVPCTDVQIAGNLHQERVGRVVDAFRAAEVGARIPVEPEPVACDGAAAECNACYPQHERARDNCEDDLPGKVPTPDKTAPLAAETAWQPAFALFVKLLEPIRTSVKAPVFEGSTQV
jgi:hypothetical protein